MQNFPSATVVSQSSRMSYHLQASNAPVERAREPNWNYDEKFASRAPVEPIVRRRLCYATALSSVRQLVRCEVLWPRLAHATTSVEPALRIHGLSHPCLLHQRRLTICISGRAPRTDRTIRSLL